ncbi:transcription factor BIM2 [Senna tora]|uniref:Transcription factor BIM2 n=1 Tax=Senna tora TaxID=362788 RepID=A0A834WLP9_9FABA|nr:transcription factor BIM2 [Senna tora]
MRAGKGNLEDDEYEEEEFGSKKEGPSSASNSNNNSSKDAKATDKASAIRSKHSVTEQRRRSKINERFQILRDLIPHSDQKRDTASFLLEVIEYVQFLQEKVQKYEGSYQAWGNEPTKLMPWRNSHWRVQSFGQPQAVKNGSGPVSPFPGKFDESNISVSPTMLSGSQNMVDPEQSRDIVSKTADRQPEFENKGIPMPMPMNANMSVPVRSDGALAHPPQGPVSDSHLTECPATSEQHNLQDELTIEGGTINISSVYSQGEEVAKLILDIYLISSADESLGNSGIRLLHNLTQALQSAGLDLSQASISVQINLGKRANKAQGFGASAPKNHDNAPSSNQAIAHFRDAGEKEWLKLKHSASCEQPARFKISREDRPNNLLGILRRPVQFLKFKSLRFGRNATDGGSCNSEVHPSRSILSRFGSPSKSGIFIRRSEPRRFKLLNIGRHCGKEIRRHKVFSVPTTPHLRRIDTVENRDDTEPLFLDAAGDGCEFIQAANRGSVVCREDNKVELGFFDFFEQMLIGEGVGPHEEVLVEAEGSYTCFFESGGEFVSEVEGVVVSVT